MENIEISVMVEGMTCNNCAAGITKSLRKEGFKDADASFLNGEVTFTEVTGKTIQDAIDNIEGLGYKIKDSGAEVSEGGLSGIEKKFIFALVFTIPLFLHMFFPNDSIINNPILQIALCLPVYALGFHHFGKSAWGSIKARLANMDVLIFIGSSAAFFYSLVGTMMYWGEPEMHNYMFFETAATIITLVLLGNVLEHRSVEQTTRNIGELTKMQSSVARIVMRIGDKEKIFETEPKSVKKGDELQVNEGDHFPVDGKIIRGSAFADESAITGESELVQKQPGDIVFSGTTLVSGNVRMEASLPAKDSTLQKIIDLVKRARRDQPDIQKLGDRVSGIFVPAVLFIAALTFVLAHWVFSIGLTQSLMNAVAVLVVSCPCAMGLATPTAVVAGVGRAAKNGILIKGGSTLERFAQSKPIIFDKTGTLTSGEFAVRTESNTIGERADKLVKSIEEHSSHPIALSFVAHFEHVDAELLTEVQEVKGEGMRANTVTGEEVFFGKNQDPNEPGDLVLKINNKAVARYTITDAILPNAKDMVDAFKTEGFKTIILSGDRKEKVLDTARALGIDEAHYAVSPQGKLDMIEALSKNEIVSMVGDGINDGPALSRAQVGISPGGGSALALDSSRIVILNRDEMQSLVTSYKISKHTYLTIKQNLFWAFFYNVVAIPIAAFGFLSPMVAALAMAFSDVIVIGNSLRLKIKKLS